MENITVHNKLLRKVFFKKILYLGDKNYLIYRNGRIEEVDKNYDGKVSLAVLGKKHYFETIKTFPFTSAKDIKSAIKTDLAAFSPFDSETVYIRKLGETSEGSRVNVWSIEKQIIENLDMASPLFIIPESALFAWWDVGSPRIFTVSRDNEQFFIYVGADNGVKSINAKAQSMDIKNFRRSIGPEAKDCLEKNISANEEYLLLLQKILYAMPIKRLKDFLNLRVNLLTIDMKRLKVDFGIAAGIIIMYLGLSALLPYYTLHQLQKEDRMLSENLSGLLEKQEKEKYFLKRQAELAQEINAYTSKTLLVNILERLLPQDAKITQLTISGNVVEVMGKAPKASRVLSALSKGKGIKNVQFIAPLSEDQRTHMEMFQLMFIYEAQEFTPKVSA